MSKVKPLLLQINTVSHLKQRYDTVGDWYRLAGVWYFAITKLPDARHRWLVLFHEFIEWGLCQMRGVSPKQIDRFDLEYEAARGGDQTPCGCKYGDDPGDDIHAPYHDEHEVATQIERLLAKVVGVDWVEYEEAIMRLPKAKKKRAA